MSATRPTNRPSTYYRAQPKTNGTYPVERKVALGALAVYLACTAGLAVVNALQADTALLTPLPDVLEVFLVPLLPTLAGYLAAWAARHQLRMTGPTRVLGETPAGTRAEGTTRAEQAEPWGGLQEGGRNAPGLHRGASRRDDRGRQLPGSVRAHTRQHAGPRSALALGLFARALGQRVLRPTRLLGQTTT